MPDMTKKQLGDILMSCVHVTRDDDGDYVTLLEKDADFRYKVAIFFVLDEVNQKLQMMGTTEFRLPEEETVRAIAFCNKWNAEKSHGQAFFADGTFRINAVLNAPGSISANYIRDSFVKFFLPVFWTYYREVGLEFDSRIVPA